MSENKIFNVSPDWSENSLINKKKYDQWYKDSINNNESFWDEHGKRIEWIKPYSVSYTHLTLPTKRIV